MNKEVSLQTKEKILKPLLDALGRYWTIWLTAIIVLIGWFTDAGLIAIALLAVMGGVLIAVFDESMYALPALWMFYYVFSASNIDLTGKAAWLAALAAPVIGIVIHIVRFRPKIFTKENLLRGFFFSLVAAGLCIALGGISMSGRNPYVVLVLVALGIIFPLAYLFICGTITKSAGRPLIEYVAMIMFTVGLVLTVQAFTFYFSLGSYEAFVDCIAGKSLHIGWGGCNNLAPTLAIAIPVTVCYSLKKSKFSWAFLILAAVQYGIILLTTSRGTIILTTVSIPFMLAYAFKKSENRLQLLVTLGVLLVVAGVLIGVFIDNIRELFGKMASMQLNDNGRFPLYRKAIANFKHRPILGMGFDYELGGYKHNSYTPFWYHSTPLQVLSCMGIVGFIAYTFLYYHRYRCFVKGRHNPLVLAIGLGLLLYDLYSWVDVNFFPPNSFIIMLIMTLAADKNMTKQDALPHSVKIAWYWKGKDIKELFRTNR